MAVILKDSKICNNCGGSFNHRKESSIYCSIKCAQYIGHKMECNRKAKKIIEKYKNTIIEDLKGEIWSPIAGYEGWYEVSNFGRVKGVFRMALTKNGRNKSNKPKLITPKLSGVGYYQSSLCNNTEKKKYPLIHRLVAEAFIPNPENKPQVNHINGIKTDNRIENLEWCTRSENCIHAVQTGLINHQHGSARPLSKLTEEKVKEIKTKISQGVKLKDLAMEYLVNPVTISNIKTGSTWRRVCI